MLERLVLAVGRVAAWLSLVIVVLMATNVVLRYLFSYGSVWAQELEWHLLVPLAVFAIPYAIACGEIVRVDVLYAKFPPLVREAINLLGAVLGLLMAVAIVWLSIKYVEQAYVIGEQSADPGGLTHRWVLKALIPAGMVFLALQFIVEVGKSVKRLRERRA